MQCRKCGAEIADKALICYRCGTATTEAKYQPVTTRGRRSSSRRLVIAVVILAILALLGLYLSGTLSTPRRVSDVAPRHLGGSTLLLTTKDAEDTMDLQEDLFKEERSFTFDSACRGSGWSRIAGVS
jgi:hypothetical protein